MEREKNKLVVHRTKRGEGERERERDMTSLSDMQKNSHARIANIVAESDWDK